MDNLDNCVCQEQLDRLVDRLDRVIRQLQDEVAIKRSDERTMKLKHPKGFVEGLERAIKLLEEAK